MHESGGSGHLAAEISNQMVRLMSETAGRGPTKARTTIGRDHVLVIFRDTLTKGEQNLVGGGFSEEVLAQRHRYQELMRPAATKMIEELTNRRVVAFMSDNHIDPDAAAEVFVLEPPEEGQRTEVEEGDASD
jgi:uncharacterized protein YbcI